MSPDNPIAENSWLVLLETLQFAQDHFERLVLARTIPKELGDEVIATLQKRLDHYKSLSSSAADVPTEVGIIPATNAETASIKAFRCWKFLEHKIGELKSTGKLSLSQFHALEMEVDERLTAIARRLSDMGIQASELEATCVVQAVVVNDDAAAPRVEERRGEPVVSASHHPRGEPRPAQRDASSFERQAEAQAKKFVENRKAENLDPVPTAASPRRNLLEILLDPRSIQWLLGLGGGLMVVGLVILLWINEYFTPPVMAVSLGLINIAVLAIGFCLIRLTRYQLAGMALTLLACLVMPLNLWYYSANSLITLDGHLWVAAVVISAIYAAAAMMLKDEMFVYVFIAGVAMTGLLMIADMQPSPEKFWEIPFPATLLVVLGLISIHAERAFEDKDGPFSRKRFGLAFFWAGHVQMAAGLLLVLCAQISGDWLYDLWFKPVFDALGQNSFADLWRAAVAGFDVSVGGNLRLRVLRFGCASVG